MSTDAARTTAATPVTPAKPAVTTTDEMQAEQAAIDKAYACLASMRHKAEGLLTDLRAAGKPDPDLEFALSRRIKLLTDSNRPLVFGRIDRADGEVWHLGRRHVEDPASDPVVIEWRVPVAMPFYRARPSDPLGLVRRRQLMVEGGRLISFADDEFRAEGAAQDGEVSRIRGGDALLAELERSRSGEMLDIVATIQAEQDEVIRAPLEGVIAVQGGPGTGKTAIGLHRAAYLLYNHPQLARAGVLVVGPNRTFLRYIAQVLPSLGEEAVVQTALADLVPSAKVRDVEPLETARLKGDPRMMRVLERALQARRRHLDEDLVVHVGLSRIVAPREEVNRLADHLASRSGPYLAGRAALRSNLVSLLHRASFRAGGPSNLDRVELGKHLAGDPVFSAALDRMWPSGSAAALVAELLASPSRLATAAEGVLDEPEVSLLARARRAAAAGKTRFTYADLALVDAAQSLLHGPPRSYGHVVVDEAQDMSPMQLAMLARRCPAGSITVLGDLAQGSSAWSYSTWEEIVAHLPQPKGWEPRHLTLGYRAPGQVLDFAARLLPYAAPGVPATESVRAGRSAPVIISSTPEALFADAGEQAARVAAEGWLVGCIVADGSVTEAARAMKAAGVAFGIADRDGLHQPITLLGATTAKGLEFDAVVVVEPAAIAADGAGIAGLRLLYVALTRPIQHLSIVHSQPLPAALA